MMIAKIKSYIAKSGNVHSLAGNVIYAFFSLLLFLLMVRLLSKDLYGQWIIFITAASLLDMFRLGLTGTGAIREISISKGDEKKQNVAASYYLSIFTTLAIGAVLLPIYFGFSIYGIETYYSPVFLFYPVLSVANLPLMQATAYSQGLQNFKRVMIIRSIQGFLNLTLTALYIYFYDASIDGIILVYSLSALITSLFTMITGWDGSRCFRYYNKERIRKILKFGKYSTLSYLSSNLLRSSDTIIISFSSVMGAEAIAVYAIPLKFVELVEIPLRSFTATAFPKLTVALQKGKEAFNKELFNYISFTFALVVPPLIIMLLFAEPLLGLLGGAEYSSSLALQKQLLLIIFFYLLLLPIDRYSGMALFAIDRPELNFYKITLMLVSNIVLDIVAVFVFQSLQLVILASVVFTLVGIIFGFKYLKIQTGFRSLHLPKEIIVYCKGIFLKIIPNNS